MKRHEDRKQRRKATRNAERAAVLPARLLGSHNSNLSFNNTPLSPFPSPSPVLVPCLYTYMGKAWRETSERVSEADKRLAGVRGGKMAHLRRAQQRRCQHGHRVGQARRVAVGAQQSFQEPKGNSALLLQHPQPLTHLCFLGEGLEAGGRKFMVNKG